MDITKKRPVRPQLHEPQSMEMDHYIKQLNLDGLSLLPGESQPQEMLGVDPATLKEKHERNEELKARLIRDMAATWVCSRCKKECPGKQVRVRVIGGKWEEIQGVRTLTGGQETLVCPKCGGEVIKLKDPYRSKLI